MRYEISRTAIIFLFDNDKKETPTKMTFSFANTKLTKTELHLICIALTLQLSGKSFVTKRNSLSKFLPPLFAYFRHTLSKYPSTSDEWQIFILHFFQYYLIGEHGAMSATNRIKTWTMSIKGIFDFWKEEDLIPIDVLIPKIGQKKAHQEMTNQRLLGETGEIATPPSESPQKILVNVDFSAPSADYLDSIQKSCLEKINLLKSVCSAHWEALLHDKAIGDHFAKQISSAMINDVIESNQYTVQGGRKRATLLTSSIRPQGHLWALAFGRHFLLNGQDRECISNKTHSKTFFRNGIIDAVGYAIFDNTTAMPKSAFDQLTKPEKYFRFLGILSSKDAAAACCLLTIEHPEFTSESIQNARLLNSKGKSYLLITDNNKSSIFSVDKPRAGTRKKVVLTSIAHQLIKNIIELTTPLRNVLKKAGDKAWRYLFLGAKLGGRIGPLDPTAKHLHATSDVVSLSRLYPTLPEHGLTTGTLDYRRIRSTMGVLRWFETGSLTEMSRRLGNSKRVVLEHYLPAPLLHAWNTRIIRRFQNTLIILAAHDEGYLLELTDFSSALDLQHFITQLIIEYPGDSSPLAKEVQTRLHQKKPPENPENAILSDGILNIQLSTTSLAYLYAFSDFAVEKFSLDELSRVDAQTSLSAAQFVDLTYLIRHACENESTASDLSELLDLPRLRLLHQRATVELPHLLKKLEKLSIHSNW